MYLDTQFCYCSLDELNTDVLLQIFDYLRPDGALFPLSVTCRAVRKATMPFLFTRCSVLIEAPVDENRFIPRSLWPYIK